MDILSEVLTTGATNLVGLFFLIFIVVVVLRSVVIVPQSSNYILERLGRYTATWKPGLHVRIPILDRVKAKVDLREQTTAFAPQSVITADNVVVNIDSVLYYQVTDPAAATYEIASYMTAIEQLTGTTLRNVIGSMDLEQTLTSRDSINAQLRGVLDEATGRWGIRINRVEIKAIDPPPQIQQAMELQLKAERDKRARILNAQGIREAAILTAEGEKQAAILEAEGRAQATVLQARGEATAIEQVFAAIHAGDADPKLLAYQYLQMLPKLGQGEGERTWLIPTELTAALNAVSNGFGSQKPKE